MTIPSVGSSSLLQQLLQARAAAAAQTDSASSDARPRSGKTCRRATGRSAAADAGLVLVGPRFRGRYVGLAALDPAERPDRPRRLVVRRRRRGRRRDGDQRRTCHGHGGPLPVTPAGRRAQRRRHGVEHDLERRQRRRRQAVGQRGSRARKPHHGGPHEAGGPPPGPPPAVGSDDSGSSTSSSTDPADLTATAWFRRRTGPDPELGVGRAGEMDVARRTRFRRNCSAS